MIGQNRSEVPVRSEVPDRSVKINAFSSGFSRDSQSPNHDRSRSADRSYSKQWPRNQASNDHSRSPGSQDSARSHSNRSSDHSQRDRSRDRSGSSEKTSYVPNSVPPFKPTNILLSRTANAVLQKRSSSKLLGEGECRKGICFNHINYEVWSRNIVFNDNIVYENINVKSSKSLHGMFTANSENPLRFNSSQGEALSTSILPKNDNYLLQIANMCERNPSQIFPKW